MLKFQPEAMSFSAILNYNTNLSSVDRANLNGWEGSLEGKVVPWVGIVADLSGHYGSQNFPTICPVIAGPCPRSI